MNYLYLVSQSKNNDYDTYDSFVICAPSEDVARHANPYNGKPLTAEQWNNGFNGSWVKSPSNVNVVKVGLADESTPLGIVCHSFNAG